MTRLHHRRRANTLAATLFGFSLLAFLQVPACLPGNLPDSATAQDTPPPVGNLDPNQEAQLRELVNQELEALIRGTDQTEEGITLIFLNPLPGPSGDQGPQGPAGPPGVDGPPGAPLIGEIRMWAGRFDAVPTGWFVCDGRALGRNVYPALGATIDQLYGDTEDPTTFFLPDFRNQSPMGADRFGSDGYNTTSVDGSDTARGGAATHTLSVGEMPPHDHPMDHDHPLSGSDSGSFGATELQFSSLGSPSAPLTSGASSRLLTGPSGSGAPHNNLHPYFAVVYIIYAGPAAPSP